MKSLSICRSCPATSYRLRSCRSSGKTAVSPDEYRMAQQRLESRKQDPQWLAKYMRGDHEAKKEFALITSILSRPIKTPQPQS